jgi:hypothetical protein
VRHLNLQSTAVQLVKVVSDRLEGDLESLHVRGGTLKGSGFGL